MTARMVVVIVVVTVGECLKVEALRIRRSKSQKTSHDTSNY